MFSPRSTYPVPAGRAARGRVLCRERVRRRAVHGARRGPGGRGTCRPVREAAAVAELTHAGSGPVAAQDHRPPGRGLYLVGLCGRSVDEPPLQPRQAGAKYTRYEAAMVQEVPLKNYQRGVVSYFLKPARAQAN